MQQLKACLALAIDARFWGRNAESSFLSGLMAVE